MHVGGFPVNRRQRLRRKIVDLDHLRDGFAGRGKLLALGLRDHALGHRLLQLADMRGADTLGDRVGARDQLEGALQPGKAAVVVDISKVGREAVDEQAAVERGRDLDVAGGDGTPGC